MQRPNSHPTGGSQWVFNASTFSSQQKTFWQHGNLLSLLSYFWKYNSFSCIESRLTYISQSKRDFSQIGYSSVQLSVSYWRMTLAKASRITQFINMMVKNIYINIHTGGLLIHGNNDLDKQILDCNVKWNHLNLSETLGNLMQWHDPLWENE